MALLAQLAEAKLFRDEAWQCVHDASLRVIEHCLLEPADPEVIAAEADLYRAQDMLWRASRLMSGYRGRHLPRRGRGTWR